MAVWENVKQHKLLYGGVALGAIVLFLVLRGSGNVSSAASGTTDNSLAEAQLQAQSQAQATSAAAEAASEQTAAGLHVADLNYQLQSDAQQLQANIAGQQLADSLQYLSLHDTLQADVANKQTEAQTHALEITTNGQIQQTALYTNALVTQQRIQAQEVSTISGNQAATAQQSWWSKAFG